MISRLILPTQSSHHMPFKELLNTWQATVIKGNPGEIGSLAGLDEVCLSLTFPSP